MPHRVHDALLILDRPIAGAGAAFAGLDGGPIPLRGNDPNAPIHPGLHVGQRLFPFASSSVSPGGFTFRTAPVGQTVYSFEGRFGRENVDGISNVSYLACVLTERRNGRVVSKKKVHFGHAVIL
jgi:hypothetical protein